MFDDVVLGVDPGTAAVGLAIVEGGTPPRVVWAGTLRTQAGTPPERRLARLHQEATSVIREHRPVAMALERLMWGRNTESAMAVSRASGVLMLVAAQAGVSVEEYAPLEVKMAVTGVGNASKDEVRRSLTRILRIEGVPREPDAADAIAVAVCHLHQSRVRGLVKGASR